MRTVEIKSGTKIRLDGAHTAVMIVTRRLILLADADANSTSMFGKMLEMNDCVAKQVAAQRLRKPNIVHRLQVGQFKGSSGITAMKPNLPRP